VSEESAEGGLFINFLSLRLRLMLLERMKKAGLTDSMWVPDVISALKKLKISHVGEKWRLNEVTKTQRELFGALGIKVPSNNRILDIRFMHK